MARKLVGAGGEGDTAGSVLEDVENDMGRGEGGLLMRRIGG